MTPTTTKWFVIIRVISGETLSNLIVYLLELPKNRRFTAINRKGYVNEKRRTIFVLLIRTSNESQTVRVFQIPWKVKTNSRKALNPKPTEIPDYPISSVMKTSNPWKTEKNPNPSNEDRLTSNLCLSKIKSTFDDPKVFIKAVPRNGFFVVKTIPSRIAYR